MQAKPPRPTGVTILGILAILGGLALLFAGAILIGVGTLASAQVANAIKNAGYTGLGNIDASTVAVFAIGLGALILILGILYFAVGVGFFGGRGWAWTLGIIVSIISIVTDIIQIALGAYSNILGVIIGLLIIYYLTRPHVKAYFGKGPGVATPMAGTPTGVASPTMMSGGMGGTGSTMGTMRCPNCGANVPTGSIKCPSCGANL
jgi:hypothetical protein